MATFDPSDQRPRAVDERRSPRSKTFLGGKVIHSGGNFIGNCTIRSLSATGAKIELPMGECLPEHVFLIPRSKPVACEAKIVWIRACQFRLNFVATHQLDDGLPAAIRYLKYIWDKTYAPVDDTPHEILADRARRPR